MQLVRGKPLSLAYLTRNAPTSFLFGLCNVAGTVDHLTAQRMRPPPTDDEFVGMADYVTESFHDLLAEDPESISDSNSSGGSLHPSRKCFMAEVEHEDTPEGHVDSVYEGNVTQCRCLTTDSLPQGT
jgi:hypothetical protein